MKDVGNQIAPRVAPTVDYIPAADFDAFEQLPAVVRAALRESRNNISAVSALARIDEGMTANEVAALIRSHDEAICVKLDEARGLR